MTGTPREKYCLPDQAAGTHALAQETGIKLHERGQDDGRENRQVKPKAGDCEGSGGGKQGDGRQNQENHRLEVNRDGHGPLHCKDVRREVGLEPKMRSSHRAFIQLQPPRMSVAADIAPKPT
jgi:hypothetical protein